MKKRAAVLLTPILLSLAFTISSFAQPWPLFWPARFDFPAGSGPTSVAIGDFDSDGNQDLAVANEYSNDIAVLMGDGTGNFGAASFYGAGHVPMSVAIGDFDSDGNQDLAVANYYSNNIAVLMGDGTGNFGAASFYGAGNGPRSVAIGDFDSDGNQDLAVANYFSNDVAILMNALGGGPPPTGAISGTVFEDIDNDQVYTEGIDLPISGASVSATGGYSDPDGSDVNGDYLISGVPPGRGYIVTSYANGYSQNSIEGIEVTSGNTTSDVNIFLVPTGTISYLVTKLDPDPNPITSTIMQGGTLHRYYLVVDAETGDPQPQISVELNNRDIFTSDGSGVVNISLQWDEIGSGDPGNPVVFSIVKVNNEPISFQDQIHFSCRVTDRVTPSSWVNETYGEFGLGYTLGTVLSGNRGSMARLVESPTYSAEEESLYIARRLRESLGTTFGLSLGAELGIVDGQVRGGAFASAGVEASHAKTREDTYKFRYNNITGTEAIIQYTLLNQPLIGGPIDPMLTNVYAFLLGLLPGQNYFEDAYRSGSWGAEWDGSGWADIEYETRWFDLKELHVEGDKSYTIDDMTGNFHEEYPKEGLEARGMTTLGPVFRESDFSGGAFTFRLYHWPESIVNLLGITDSQGIFIYDGKLIGQLILVVNSNRELKEIRLNFRKIEDNETPVMETDVLFTITANDPSTLEEIVALAEESQSLWESLVGPLYEYEIFLGSSSFANFLSSFFDKIDEFQENGVDVAVSYEKTQKKINVDQGAWVNLNVAFGLSFQVDIGKNYEQGKEMVLGRGTYHRGSFRELETYREDTYTPDSNESMSGVEQNALDTLGDMIWDAFTSLFTEVQDGIDTILNIGNSILHLGAGALTGGTQLQATFWSWWGGRPGILARDLDRETLTARTRIKSIAQEGANLHYGIGGFFKLSPENAALLAPSTLTIAYDQSEVDSIDESSLAMYEWSDANDKWIYYGGTVDTLNNTVIASIDSLKLFTLAPVMPYGDFELNPESSILPADSASTTLVNSTTIINNDSSMVSDGTMISIFTDGGEVLDADADTSLEGVQVPTSNGIVSFTLMSGRIAMNASLTAMSVEGEAMGTGTVTFTDSLPPAPPRWLSAISENEAIRLNWQKNGEIDLAGYRVYYDSDTSGPPYDGTATIWGSPSPIDVGGALERIVSGLENDTLYYFALTAYDVSGNESDYSTEITMRPGSRIGWTLATYQDQVFPGGSLEFSGDFDSTSILPSSSMKLGFKVLDSSYEYTSPQNLDSGLRWI